MKIGPPTDKNSAPAAAAPVRTEPPGPVKPNPVTAKAAAGGSSSAVANAPSSTAAAAAVNAKAGNVESSANVQLSRTASNLISSQQAANADIDTEKVDRISQQIADGKFQVNAAAIADKLIANAQELLGKVPQ